MEDNNFKLCGGTLFALLTTAKTNRKRGIEKPQSLSQESLMLDLVKIYNPSAYSSSSIKKDTNNYKVCSIKDCGSFDFSNKELIKQFDYEIKNNYYNKLIQMDKLLHHYLEIKKEPVINKLVRSILELIKLDKTIDNNDKFYICQDGKPMSKTAILLEETFNLSSFILGVFHYIIVNEIDNTLGAPTYNTWYFAPGDNKKHEFTSNIGENYKSITFEINLEDATFENYTKDEIEAESSSTDDIIYETNSTQDTKENKTLNVNYQIGKNNFNNIGTLNFYDQD